MPTRGPAHVVLCQSTSWASGRVGAARHLRFKTEGQSLHRLPQAEQLQCSTPLQGSPVGHFVRSWQMSSAEPKSGPLSPTQSKLSTVSSR